MLKKRLNNIASRGSVVYFLGTLLISLIPIGIGVFIFLGLERFFPRFKNGATTYLRFCVDLFLRIQPFSYRLPPLPVIKRERKLLFVANHRSVLDVFFLLSRIKRLRVVGKTSLFQVPLLGLLMKISRQIPFDKDLVKNVKEGIDAGDSILFFPELTRCPLAMRGTNKFSQIPFLIAQEEDALIVPLVIFNSDALWAKGSREIFYKAPYDISVLDAIDSRCVKNPIHLRSLVRDKINEALARYQRSQQ